MDKLYDLIPFIQDPMIRKVLSSLAVIVLFWLINWLLVSITHRRVEDPKTRYNLKKTISYVLMILGILVVGRIWFQAFESAATFLGLLSAGIAIALRDPLVNMVAWVFILWRKPFVVGNRIQVGEHAGDVIDIRVFQFSILEIGNWVQADQSTGRIIHIPTGKVFEQALCNFDMGFKYIWNEIPVLITFESDWQKAKRILQEIIDEHSGPMVKDAEQEIIASAKKFLIHYKSVTPIVYTSVEDSGVLLTIRHLTEIRKRRGGTQKIWEQILTRFAAEENIDLAYPTYRRVQ